MSRGKKKPKAKSAKTRKERKHERENKAKVEPKPKNNISNRDAVKSLVELMLLYEGKRVQKMIDEGAVMYDRKLCPECGRYYCINTCWKNSFCDECAMDRDKEKILASGGIYTGCQTTFTGKMLCQKCKGD